MSAPPASSASSSAMPERRLDRKRSSSRPATLADEVGVLGQVGVGVAHDLDDRLDHAGADGPRRPEQAGPQHGAADDPAQHVPAVLVRGEDAVRDHERHRPGVVRQHPQGHVGFGVVAISAPGQRLGPGDQRPQDVGLPDRGSALQDGEHPLETGAGVDARLGQRHQLTGSLAVVGLENEVPELDVTRLAAAHRAAADPPFGAPVEVDLRTRPARAGVAHLPEIVFFRALDARPRDTDDCRPRCRRPRRQSV